MASVVLFHYIKVKTAIGEFHCIFKAFRQHDSCEFLLLMLDGLHDCLSKGVTSVHAMEEVVNGKSHLILQLF